MLLDLRALYVNNATSNGSSATIVGPIAWNIVRWEPRTTFTRGFSAGTVQSITLGALGAASSPSFSAVATGSIALGAAGVTASPLFTTVATPSITLAGLGITNQASSIGPISPQWQVILGGQPRRRGHVAGSWVVVGGAPSTASGSIILAGLGITASPLFTAPAAPSITLSPIGVVGAGAATAQVSSPQWRVILGGQPRRRGYAAIPWIVVGSGPSTATGSITLASLGIVAAGGLESDAAGSITLAGLGVVGSGGAGAIGTAQWQVIAGGQPRRRGYAAIPSIVVGGAPSDSNGSVLLGSLVVAGAGGLESDAAGSITLGTIGVPGIGLYESDATGTILFVGLGAVGSGTGPPITSVYGLGSSVMMSKRIPLSGLQFAMVYW